MRILSDRANSTIRFQDRGELGIFQKLVEGQRAVSEDVSVVKQGCAERQGRDPLGPLRPYYGEMALPSETGSTFLERPSFLELTRYPKLCNRDMPVSGIGAMHLAQLRTRPCLQGAYSLKEK